jgi:tetratricopeptide (TPR) repeat protein
MELIQSGSLRQAEDLLQESISDLPLSEIITIKQQLAQAHISAGSLDRALELYLELNDGGDSDFITMHNIGILHQQLGDYSKARLVFTEMLTVYPDDFRPPMRLALIVLEEQQILDNEMRDYSEALQMYTLAQELNNSDDVDLMRLSGFMAELKSHGWFD